MLAENLCIADGWRDDRGFNERFSLSQQLPHVLAQMAGWIRFDACLELAPIIPHAGAKIGKASAFVNDRASLESIER